jgi:hypothetical protein
MNITKLSLSSVLLITLGISPLFANEKKIDSLVPQPPAETRQVTPPNWPKLLTMREQKSLKLNPDLFKSSLFQQGNIHKKLGGGDAGGGNSLAIRFMALTSQGIYGLKENQLPPGITKQRLLKTLSEAKILITQNDLFVEDKESGILQLSEAINFPTLKTIVLNEKSLRQITDTQLLQSLGIHEILSLLGLESTGRYQLSHQKFENFQFEDFSFDKLPLGTKISFTRTIPFNVNTSFISFEPDSGYNFAIENPTDGGRQIHVLPRTCTLKKIEDFNYFKKYGSHPSLNRVMTFEGDSVCQKMKIVFWPAANNQGRTSVWYPSWKSSETQSFQRQSLELSSGLGVEVILPEPNEI